VVLQISDKGFTTMGNRLKLTSTSVERLSDAGIYWDTQTPGLGVRVSDSGLRTYFYKRRVKGSGVERNVTLARHGDPVLVDGVLRTFPFGAEDARAKAAAVQAQMLAGVDPVQQRKDAEVAAVVKAEKDKAQSTSLQQTIDHYIEHHRVNGRPLRPKTKKDYCDFMARHFKTWLPQPVAGITRGMCLDKITEIEKGSAIQAHKCTTYLSLFLNHAREWHANPVTGEYTILAVNPVERARKIKKTHAPKPRDRRIELSKIGAAWSLLRKRAEHPKREMDRTAADFISTLILTGWRAFECCALEWSWIDLQAKTIKLPGDVHADNELGFSGTKTHNEATYPLSDALHAILTMRSELESKDARYVFPSRGDGEMPHILKAGGTMRALAKITGCTKEVDGKTKYLLSPHDLRRSAESAALAVKVDYSLRQRLLAHKPQAVHDSAYGNDPSPEVLRPAVNAIANYIVDAGKVYDAQQAGHNVVSIADRKRTW
jgi:integrase